MEEKQVEATQVSEREFIESKNAHYLDEDTILNIISIGETDTKEALADKEIFLKLLSRVEGKVNVLLDLNKSGKQSPEARKIRKDLTEHEKVNKFAIYGIHPVARVMASFVIGVTKKKDVRFFKTREEALAWLKQ